MRRTLDKIIILLVIILTVSCQSNFFDGKAPENPELKKYAIIFNYQTKTDNITKDDFFRYMENIGSIYLDLAKNEHLSFTVNNSVIKNGTEILNSEEVSGQFVKHKYKVFIDKENGYIKWISNPSEVILKKWNFKIEMVTILEFYFTEGVYKTELSLVFGSKKDLDSSLNHGVRDIWDSHNSREMENGRIIFDFLKKSGQFYNDPNMWDIMEIRRDLK